MDKEVNLIILPFEFGRPIEHEKDIREAQWFHGDLETLTKLWFCCGLGKFGGCELVVVK